MHYSNQGVDGSDPAFYRQTQPRPEKLVMTYRPAIGFGIAVMALAAPLAAPVLAESVDPARAPVQALSDGLIGIMKNASRLGFSGRAAQITPIVDRAFDLPLTARLTVGTAWTTATPADRAALVAAFRKLTVNQYAANFDGYSGQSFIVDPKVEVRGGDRVVRTTLTQPKGEPVKIAYRLREAGSEWKIIDVFYQNSISSLATRRADFQSILDKGGVKALVGHVNALADKAGR